MGAGSWGTTFAQILSDAGTETMLWCRRGEVAESINTTSRNPQYLPDCTLPGALRATADPEQALAGADLVVLAVPAQSLRKNLTSWAGMIPHGESLVSLMKGIEIERGVQVREMVV